ncbi:RNA-directed DNA polymerase, eukaryota [Tanacetum coccineum]
MVEDSWKSSSFIEENNIITLKKKLQALKTSIRQWIKDDNVCSKSARMSIHNRLSALDKSIDQGRCNNELLSERSKLLKEIHDLKSIDTLDMIQKAKIHWAIEGDENSKYFHGITNKKCSHLAIRGVLVGDWIVEPSLVKDEFLNHFSNRFVAPSSHRLLIDFQFPTTLSSDQMYDIERDVTYDEIKNAVWDCRTNKSPGPDGTFPPGCNSSFISLIPKTHEAKVVKDFRPISLIGSVYKIIAKILANRLSLVISSLIKLLSWCKHKKIKSMIFEVDFEKAFDLVRWDYLDDVLNKFGFGVKWRGWIQGCFNSARGSILVNGSPTSKFKFFKGLKQGDPLSPFLFILIMESLHLSFKNVVDAGLYKGIRIDDTLNMSHLFYADDVVFVGRWDQTNVATIVNVLKCFFLASGLKIVSLKIW